MPNSYLPELFPHNNENDTKFRFVPEDYEDLALSVIFALLQITKYLNSISAVKCQDLWWCNKKDDDIDDDMRRISDTEYDHLLGMSLYTGIVYWSMFALDTYCMHSGGIYQKRIDAIKLVLGTLPIMLLAASFGDVTGFHQRQKHYLKGYSSDSEYLGMGFAYSGAFLVCVTNICKIFMRDQHKIHLAHNIGTIGYLPVLVLISMVKADRVNSFKLISIWGGITLFCRIRTSYLFCLIRKNLLEYQEYNLSLDGLLIPDEQVEELPSLAADSPAAALSNHDSPLSALPFSVDTGESSAYSMYELLLGGAEGGASIDTNTSPSLDLHAQCYLEVIAYSFIFALVEYSKHINSEGQQNVTDGYIAFDDDMNIKDPEYYHLLRMSLYTGAIYWSMFLMETFIGKCCGERSKARIDKIKLCLEVLPIVFTAYSYVDAGDYHLRDGALEQDTARYNNRYFRISKLGYESIAYFGVALVLVTNPLKIILPDQAKIDIAHSIGSCGYVCVLFLMSTIDGDRLNSFKLISTWAGIALFCRLRNTAVDAALRKQLKATFQELLDAALPQLDVPSAQVPDAQVSRREDSQPLVSVAGIFDSTHPDDRGQQGQEEQILQILQGP